MNPIFSYSVCTSRPLFDDPVFINMETVKIHNVFLKNNYSSLAILKKSFFEHEELISIETKYFKRDMVNLFNTKSQH